MRTKLKTEKNKIEERKLVVESRTENLSIIRDFVYSAALAVGFNDEIIENITLAVDEACTNIIKHAYKSNPNGQIEIKLNSDSNNFFIQIIDFGKSFAPDIIPEPNMQDYFREKRVGGLGMYLMKKLMDEVKYTSIPGKYNQVLLTKLIHTNGRA